jgi:hypothetical protein
MMRNICGLDAVSPFTIIIIIMSQSLDMPQDWKKNYSILDKPLENHNTRLCH